MELFDSYKKLFSIDSVKQSKKYYLDEKNGKKLISPTFAPCIHDLAHLNKVEGETISLGLRARTSNSQQS